MTAIPVPKAVQIVTVRYVALCVGVLAGHLGRCCLFTGDGTRLSPELDISRAQQEPRSYCRRKYRGGAGSA